MDQRHILSPNHYRPLFVSSCRRNYVVVGYRKVLRDSSALTPDTLFDIVWGGESVKMDRACCGNCSPPPDHHPSQSASDDGGGDGGDSDVHCVVTEVVNEDRCSSLNVEGEMESGSSRSGEASWAQKQR